MEEVGLRLENPSLRILFSSLAYAKVSLKRLLSKDLDERTLQDLVFSKRFRAIGFTRLKMERIERVTILRFQTQLPLISTTETSSLHVFRTRAERRHQSSNRFYVLFVRGPLLWDTELCKSMFGVPSRSLGRSLHAWRRRSTAHESSGFVILNSFPRKKVAPECCSVEGDFFPRKMTFHGGRGSS